MFSVRECFHHSSKYSIGIWRICSASNNSNKRLNMNFLILSLLHIWWPYRYLNLFCRWAHMVCALYIPGVTFGDVDKLSPITLFELQQSKWGAKVRIISHHTVLYSSRTEKKDHRFNTPSYNSKLMLIASDLLIKFWFCRRALSVKTYVSVELEFA